MKEIVLKAMGQAINKTVAIAEIIKVSICFPLILLCFSILHYAKDSVLSF